ncbi:serine/threonine-protein kinase [Nocardiopsis sp. CNT-189]|uniref:serine/threonine-protein kinase n=1 Tax=Nocardiopsis oceanisediminis TaxID=2816862 RepID=UPI003B3B7A46
MSTEDPTEIGGYRLLGRIGSGGQGTVYLGAPLRGGSRVAIKRLDGHALGGTDIRRRFVREADAARKVASFCTAAVLDADFEADPPYIVSEYVEGLSLQQRIRQDGPMSGGDLTRLAVATATALAAIHEAGIVHRDLKPGNVLLGGGGARVIDFGIAQIAEGTGTLTDSVIGTPAYMAPEQIEHGRASPESDVFAWGAVVSFAATGASPFDGATVPNVLHNVIHTEPDLGALPDPLEPVVAAALAKDPADRPSAFDVLTTLLGRRAGPTRTLDQAMRDARTVVLDGDGAAPDAAPPPAPPASSPDRPPASGPGRPKAGRRWLIGAGAVVSGAALVGAGVLLGNALGPNGGGPGTGGTGTGEDGADRGGAVPEGGGVARFTEDEAGSWEGVAESGLLYEVRLEAGERTAALDSPDDDTCSTELRLLEGDGGTYRANIVFEGMEPNRCVDSSRFWELSHEAVVTIADDTMSIEFYEADTDAPAETTVAFSRVE